MASQDDNGNEAPRLFGKDPYRKQGPPAGEYTHPAEEQTEQPGAPPPARQPPDLPTQPIQRIPPEPPDLPTQPIQRIPPEPPVLPTPPSGMPDLDGMVQDLLGGPTGISENAAGYPAGGGPIQDAEEIAAEIGISTPERYRESTIWLIGFVFYAILGAFEFGIASYIASNNHTARNWMALAIVVLVAILHGIHRACEKWRRWRKDDIRSD